MRNAPGPSTLRTKYGIPDPKLNRRVKVLAIKLAELKHVSARKLFTKTREKRVAEARAILMYILADQGYSREEMGRVFNRHHSTVTASMLRITNKLQEPEHTKELQHLIEFMREYNARLTEAAMTKALSDI